MTTLYLKAARCVIPDPPQIFSTDVLIRDGYVAQVAANLMPTAEAEVIELNGKLLMPGLVCAHTHLYSTLARGMPGPMEPPRNFVQILERLWWRLDRALDEESLYLSALVGAIEAVRVGTTCLIDHNASPGFIRGSLETVARALEEVGLRGVLCYEVTDRGGLEERDEGLEESRAFLEQIRSSRWSRTLRGLVGAHASFTLSDDSLKRCADVVRQFDVGLHIHVAEDVYDQLHAREHYGRAVVERLAQHGLLNEKTILAHGVHLSSDELSLIEQAGSWLVHNPRSNLNNSVGRAPVERFGDRVALGTDGIGADMFEESKFAFFRAREARREATAESYLRMLHNGQQILAPLFNATFGRIEPGAVADLVVLDYEPPTPLTAENLAWHWMFGLASWQVESVMVAGRLIYHDRRLLTVDQASIYRRAREVAVKLWQRILSRTS